MKKSINAGLGILVALAIASAHAGVDDKPAPRDYSPLPGNAVRLYPVDTGHAAGSAPRRASGDTAPQAKKAVLPQPGGGAMILAGLLAVGAIARRRMSA